MNLIRNNIIIHWECLDLSHLISIKCHPKKKLWCVSVQSKINIPHIEFVDEQFVRGVTTESTKVITIIIIKCLCSYKVYQN